MKAAHDRYEATRPPLPEVLLERPSDRAMDLPEAHWDSVSRGWPEGSPFMFSEPNVVDMEVALERGAWTGEKRARAQEIVATSGAYSEADDAALQVSGYDEDDEDTAERDESTERHAEAAWEIARTPARTMAGLLFKAEVAFSVAGWDGDPETTHAAAAEAEGLSETMVALFIVRDLLQIATTKASF
jgi:hypothetical protein